MQTPNAAHDQKCHVAPYFNSFTKQSSNAIDDTCNIISLKYNNTDLV